MGSGTMMPGWDSGLEGARVGSVRRIVVPPALGYGEQGSPDGKIPRNATLTFDVKVLKIERIEDEPLLDPLLDPRKVRAAPRSSGG
jgi:FKBP-type peptidyl-prolyl cis-trans isomerase 2